MDAAELRDLLGVADNLKRAVESIPHDAREDARIKGIDTSAALAAPGVVAVLTGQDIAADKVNGRAQFGIGSGAVTGSSNVARQRAMFAATVLCG